MGDSDSESQYSDDSGRQTPINRRSPSADSERHARRSASRGSSRGPSRSRSPLKEDDEKRALRAENQALKREMSKMTQTIRDQEARIANLEARIQIHHKESMGQLDQITNLIREQAAAKTTVESMEIDPSPKEEPPKPKRPKKSTAQATQDPIQVSPLQVSSPQVQTGPPQPGPSQEESTQPADEEKKTKIPPVVLRRKDQWNEVSKKLKDKGVQYSKARLIGDGIQIVPATAEDHRKLTRTLAEDKREYHTYSLPEDKLLRVVLRGIPDGVPLEEVKEDLLDQGHSPVSIQRMTSRRTKAAMPLLLVQVPESDDKILQVSRCCGLVVRVERQRAAPAVSQCHRCQRFGHSQSKCSAQPKCVKCAGAHHSGDCKKPPTSAAKCANCDGAHPASYQGCTKYPKRKTAAPPQQTRAKPSQAQTRPTPAQPRTGERTPAKSFAEAARRGTTTQGKSTPGKTTPTPTAHPGNAVAMDLTAALAQMQQMCAAMSAFFAQMPALTKG